jgi:hypothetical protein
MDNMPKYAKDMNDEEWEKILNQCSGYLDQDINLEIDGQFTKRLLSLMKKVQERNNKG